MSLAALFIASLLGSPHCAGMCGGFVAFYAGNSKGIFPHIAYNIGRLLTYVLLGAIAGLLGYSLDGIGEVAGFQRITMLLTAVCLIIWGIRGLISSKPIRIGEYPKSGIFKFVRRIFARVMSSDNSPETNWTLRALGIGMLSTFLPCGWLYTFVALAAASGDPANGALVMAVFWLGTLPVMASLAGITKVLSTSMRQYVPRVTALLLLLAGIFALSGHSGLLLTGNSHHSHKHMLPGLERADTQGTGTHDTGTHDTGASHHYKH